MGKKLVIVESPTKVKSISKYLGKDYIVSSSKGHIRDLSTKGKYGLGVDIEDHFKPDYKTIKGKKKVIDELKKKRNKPIKYISQPIRTAKEKPFPGTFINVLV